MPSLLDLLHWGINFLHKYVKSYPFSVQTRIKFYWVNCFPPLISMFFNLFWQFSCLNHLWLVSRLISYLPKQFVNWSLRVFCTFTRPIQLNWIVYIFKLHCYIDNGRKMSCTIIWFISTLNSQTSEQRLTYLPRPKNTLLSSSQGVLCLNAVSKRDSATQRMEPTHHSCFESLSLQEWSPLRS